MTAPLRIVSLVPGATQAACALGLRSLLVGVTHECAGTADLSGLDLPVLTRTRLPVGASGSAIDGAVKTAAANRNEIHVLDAQALAALRPDLVILPGDPSGDWRTPCTPPPATLRAALAACAEPPRPMAWQPTRLTEVFGSMRALGEAVSRGAEAARLVAELRARVEAVKIRVAGAMTKPRVALLTWVNPPVGPGGLLAELVKLAGGVSVLGTAAEPARALDWDHVVAVKPEVIVAAPCSFPLERARAEVESMKRPALAATPAGRFGQVHVMDARAHLSAPGPGLVRGLEILATLIHPELPWPDRMLAGAVSRPVAVE